MLDQALSTSEFWIKYSGLAVVVCDAQLVPFSIPSVLSAQAAQVQTTQKTLHKCMQHGSKHADKRQADSINCLTPLAGWTSTTHGRSMWDPHAVAAVPALVRTSESSVIGCNKCALSHKVLT